MEKNKTISVTNKYDSKTKNSVISFTKRKINPNACEHISDENRNLITMYNEKIQFLEKIIELKDIEIQFMRNKCKEYDKIVNNIKNVKKLEK